MQYTRTQLALFFLGYPFYPVLSVFNYICVYVIWFPSVVFILLSQDRTTNFNHLNCVNILNKDLLSILFVTTGLFC